MGRSILKHEEPGNDPLIGLQNDIAALEAALESIRNELRPFQSEIHRRLDKEIRQIQELTELYKKQKKAKKEKRLEQKKKGKNYKEPKQLSIHTAKQDSSADVSEDEQKELKRLYKEAVLHFRPDKFASEGDLDKINTFTAITAQLNGIYKRGDLEELISFYQHIMHERGEEVDSERIDHFADPKRRVAALKRKKEQLQKQLDDLRCSYIYMVLKSYAKPIMFIDELQLQFKERILQLQKRTRKG